MVATGSATACRSAGSGAAVCSASARRPAAVCRAGARRAFGALMEFARCAIVGRAQAGCSCAGDWWDRLGRAAACTIRARPDSRSVLERGRLVSAGSTCLGSAVASGRVSGLGGTEDRRARGAAGTILVCTGRQPAACTRSRAAGVDPIGSAGACPMVASAPVTSAG